MFTKYVQILARRRSKSANIYSKVLILLYCNHQVEIKFSNQVLKVLQAKRRDGGIYVCVASNEVGSIQQAYTLEVLGQFLC